MNNSLGKKFEQKFKEDFLKIPGSELIRLPDQMSGYKATSKNICDFVGYIYPNLYLIECKSVKGKSFPFTNLSQYDKMIAKTGKRGIIAGVIIWFYQHDQVVFVPIETVQQIMNEGKKSLNIQLINDNKYNIIQVPSKKLRTFMDSDYSILTKIYSQED